jgi:hypothetical protein
MTRKIKTMVIALGVLVLLGGGYFGSTVYKKKKAETVPSSYTPTPRLGNLESSNLVKIETSGLTLEKKGDVWELVSLEGQTPPDGIELDQSQINSLTYSLASVWIDRVVEEEPEDLSVYGLDNPLARASVTDSEGKRVEYLRGEMTPSRTSYYVMEEGDPKVYIVSAYSADNFSFTLDKIRTRYLIPNFDISTLTHLTIELPEARIEIGPKPEMLPNYLTTSFTAFLMTSPYKLARGVDSEALGKLMEPLGSLQIEDFIDDNPSSLAPYGLDKPVKLFVQAKESEPLDLLIGSEAGGSRYAKLAGSGRVFTLRGLDDVLTIKPFSLVDKFALILNIDLVERLTITGGVRRLDAEFQGQGDDGVYFLNGKQAENKSFKTWYQAVIGLLSDAELPGPVNPDATGKITIEYQLNIFPGARASITLIPYNRDFYALSQEGTMEFLISRNQVNRIWETADAMAFE